VNSTNSGENTRTDSIVIYAAVFASIRVKYLLEVPAELIRRQHEGCAAMGKSRRVVMTSQVKVHTMQHLFDEELMGLASGASGRKWGREVNRRPVRCGREGNDDCTNSA
jgi:hypothetical protein